MFSLNRLSNRLFVATVTATIAIPMSFLNAQPPGGPGRGGPGFGGPGGGFGRPGSARPMSQSMLLQMKEVQYDLGISEEQINQLTSSSKNLRESIEGEVSELRDTLREQRRQARENGQFQRGQGQQPPFRDENFEPDEEDPRFKLRSMMEEMRTKEQEGVNNSLSSSQLERLEQIQIQATLQTVGAIAYLEGDIADEIGVNDRQREKINSRYQEVMQEMRSMRGAPREEMEEFREDTNKQIFRMFNSKQRKALIKMGGEPIELDFSQLRGQNPRGGNRDGENGERRRGPRGDRQDTEA